MNVAISLADKFGDQITQIAANTLSVTDTSSKFHLKRNTQIYKNASFILCIVHYKLLLFTYSITSGLYQYESFSMPCGQNYWDQQRYFTIQLYILIISLYLSYVFILRIYHFIIIIIFFLHPYIYIYIYI